MRFYTIDDSLKEAIDKATAAVRVRVEIQRGARFEAVFERDIIEASFYGLKEVAGGTSARGEVLLDNPNGMYSAENGAGREVRVSFSVGEGLPWFQRFTFFVDDKGFQDVRGPGRVRRVLLGLRDRSAFLRRTDESRDWTQPEVFTYSVVCDKTQSEKSLAHRIAKRAGFAAGDIDCSTIPIGIPYAKLARNTWAELSALATAYRCHLECPVEKPLVFAHSPYQDEPLSAEECSYSFRGEDIFYLRITERADWYRNTVRLKINMPVGLEKQEIWRYEDAPVLYDSNLAPVYPFRGAALRDIEQEGYEARYVIKGGNMKDRDVIYADHIDTKGEAELRLEYEGGPFSYGAYDVSSHYDKALVRLAGEGDGELYRAAIYGRPIVLDLNRSCFLRDDAGAALHGTCALNVTGSYFSEDVFNGRTQYEDWTARELAERLQARREITVKTHRALFHGRVGAGVQIQTRDGGVYGTVGGFSLRYKREGAFVAGFKITEEIKGKG
jgi:hypothetical protein